MRNNSSSFPEQEHDDVSSHLHQLLQDLFCCTLAPPLAAGFSS